MNVQHERRRGRERRQFNPTSVWAGPERRLLVDQRKRLLVEYRMHDDGDDDASPYWTAHVSVRPPE